MDPECQPTRATERKTECGGYLSRVAAREARLHRYLESLVFAGRIQLDGLLLTHCEYELGTGSRDVDASDGREDGGRREHDQAEGNNAGEVRPCSHHPRSMLVDLEPFNVYPGEKVSEGCGDDQRTNQCSCCKVSTESVRCDDESPCACARRQENDKVAIDAMEEDDFVSDGWDELETDQDCSLM